ncbi:MAG: ZIP family metal transporter [Candidatus Magasanikbacteria bacterium]|nr:ZIP family metal transporter [Candidatus Magasanikbacteria bacterium]
MNTVVILSLIITVSLLGLLGGVLLLWKETLARRVSHFLVSFGAGALIGIVFFDLLPEALEDAADAAHVLQIVFAGFLLFYIIEKSISWYHCHHHEAVTNVPRYLIVLGDFIHNSIDGMLIAATFLVDVRLGLIAAVGVLLHELPQEVGDFGILLHSGLSRARVIGYNLLSSVGALVGGVLVLLFGARLEAFAPVLIALVAGNFLYIAAVDLIPSTHHHENASRHREALHVAVFIFGAALMWVISETLHV